VLHEISCKDKAKRRRSDKQAKALYANDVVEKVNKEQR